MDVVAGLSPLSFAAPDEAATARPFPLAMCWAIWLVASAVLWAIALRAAAWLF